MNLLELFNSFFASKIGQALTIAALTALLTFLIRPKGKLVWAVSHQHHYSIPRIDPEGAFPVRTQQIWFQNVGRLPIEELEIILNWKPQHFELWNPRKYTTSVLPDERFVISVPNLSSREYFTISQLDTFNELPIVLGVRWKAGLGKNIPMAPQQVFKPWILWTMGIFLMIGVATSLYLILQFVLWQIEPIPHKDATSSPRPEIQQDSSEQ